jgi:hypothetical protein
VGSIHSGASTPQRATIEGSTEELLTTTSEEGSFGHPSLKQCSTRALFAPTATATWKENAPATTRFPLQTAEPQPETNHRSKRHRARYEKQLTQAHALHPTADPRTVSRRSHLTGKQTATTVQPYAPPRHEPVLKTERILIVDVTSTQAQTKDLAL